MLDMQTGIEPASVLCFGKMKRINFLAADFDEAYWREDAKAVLYFDRDRLRFLSVRGLISSPACSSHSSVSI